MRKGIMGSLGTFHSTKNSGNSGWGSEWEGHFPESHFGNLGVPGCPNIPESVGKTGKF